MGAMRRHGAVSLVFSLLAATSLAATGFELATTTVAGPPATAGDGSGFLTAWIETDAGATNYAARIRAFTRSGPAGSGSVRLGSTYYGENIGVAFGGGVYLVVWQDSGRNIVGSLVTPSGIAAPPFVIGQGASPAVAWNGSEFFVVWSAERKTAFGFTNRIDGVPVSSSGVLRGAPRQITPEPQPLAERPADEQLFVTPKIAWTGHDYVVVWRGDFAILTCVATCYHPPPSYLLMTRFAADGSPSAAQPAMLIAPFVDIWSARIATNGSTVAVAVDADDHVDVIVVQPDLTISRRTLFQWSYLNGYGNSSASDIAFDGTSYVVAWRARDGVRSWLETARLTADGNAIPLTRGALQIDDVRIFDDGRPSIGGAAFTDTPIVVSEGNRIRAYFGDLPGAPAAPMPPRNFESDGLHLTWGGGDGAEGFLVLRHTGGVYPLAVVRDGTARATNLPFDYHTALRVRAYNAGGVTDLDEGQRRRAAHH